MITQTESNVASILANKRSADVVELGRRRTMRVEDLGRELKSTSRLAELLHEHLAEHNVVFALERRAEYHSDAIVERAHKQRLVGSVVDHRGLDRSTIAPLLTLEVLLEDRGEAVALEQARLHGNLAPILRHLTQVE